MENNIPDSNKSVETTRTEFGLKGKDMKTRCVLKVAFNKRRDNVKTTILSSASCSHPPLLIIKLNIKYEGDSCSANLTIFSSTISMTTTFMSEVEKPSSSDTELT